MQGAGIFSKLGGYVKGAARQAAYSVGAAGVYGKFAHSAMGRTIGSAGRTAAYGAAAGGLYGGTMGDGVLSGAAGGAALGLGGRYGRAAGRGARAYLGSNGPVSYAGLGLNMRMAAQSRMARDYRGTVMRANRGYNNFKARRGGK